MKSGTLATLVAFASCAATTGVAFAQVKPETLVKQRQSAMTLQGKYFGPLAAMAGGKAPYDAAVVARNATYLDLLGKMAWDGFDPGTSGEKSRALPEIYKEPAKFKEAADKFQVEIGKLVVASKSGNESAAKNAIGDIGKACSACHDDFRSK